MDDKIKEFLKIDKEYQPILEEIEKEVEHILRKVFNYGTGIGDMNISMSEDTTYVDFDYTCRGYTDRESEGFPTELLFQTDEFIDNYIAEQKRKSIQDAKRAEKEKVERLEREEREKLKELIEKYGDTI